MNKLKKLIWIISVIHYTQCTFPFLIFYHPICVMWWIVVDCWIVASLYTPVFSCVTMEHQNPNRGTPVWSIAVLCSVSPRSLAVSSITSQHSIVLTKLVVLPMTIFSSQISLGDQQIFRDWVW